MLRGGAGRPSLGLVLVLGLRARRAVAGLVRTVVVWWALWTWLCWRKRMFVSSVEEEFMWGWRMRRRWFGVEMGGGWTSQARVV